MTPRKKLPSVELLNELFEYKDGQLIRKTAPSRRNKVGDVAGKSDRDGYISIVIKGKGYKAHRLIYKMFTGEEHDHIDHINTNTSDNKIENLRPLTHQQNTAIKKCKGYSFNKATQKYRAQIKSNGKQKHIGTFLTAECAEAAYQLKHSEVYGELSPFYKIFN